MTPSGIKIRSSDNGVKAKTKIAKEPYFAKSLSKKAMFFSLRFLIVFLPPKPTRYPENSPNVPPAVAVIIMSKGLNKPEPPSIKTIALSGIGKRLDDAPIRLTTKIPKYPY